MSTYWRYKCVDCDEDTEASFNRGDNALIEFYHAWHILRPYRFRDVAPVLTLIGKQWESIELYEFILKHNDCNIVLANEYGDKRKIPELLPMQGD